jgi:hypothetical protein
MPPALALVAVGVWNFAQWRAVAVEAGRVRDLSERVQAARSAPAAVADVRFAKPKAALAEGPIDWKRLAAQFKEMEESGGMGDIRTMIAFQKRLAAMSRDELVAALEEIASLELDAGQRELLEQMLVSPLIGKDPELALTTFASRIPLDDDGVAWQLSSALAAWAKINPAAASAWFDRQIAAGLFDSKSLDGQSQTRTEFEAAMTGVLLDSDVAAANRRIAALPEDQRREALEQISFSELSAPGQKAYMEMVRGLIPQDEREGSFSHVISELVPDGEYARVGAFLDEIQATPEERSVSAREAANTRLEEIAGEREVTRQDVDAMREWLKLQAPGTEDRVTGEALADAAQEGGEFGFAEASKLALEYHQTSGNDDVLVAFLESFAARSNLDEALPLADKITDPARRDAILKRLK